MKTLSLPIKVLIGACLGIVAGLLLGQYAAIFRPIGLLYIMLLQSVVFPYLIASLVHGLGKISPGLFRLIFKRSWWTYLFVVVVVFICLFILSFAIGKPRPLLIYPVSHLQNPLPQLLNLLVPDNLFAALSLNYVPAVVVFSILFGITIQKIEKKTAFLQMLNTVAQTCLEFWGWLIYFAPYALFALLADTAGTIQWPLLQGIGVYLLMFVISALILALWCLPKLLCCLVPISYREFMKHMRGAFIASAATSLSVSALPYINDYVMKTLEDKNTSKEFNQEVVETSLAVSYPLGQFGNFYIYLFTLFTAFYYSHPFSLAQQLLLPIVSWLSSIGSPSTTVNSVQFLSQWLNLPSLTIELYIELMTITRYFQVLLSVTGMAFLSITIVLGYYGKLRIRYRSLLTNLILTFAILILFSYTIILLGPRPHLNQKNNYLTFSLPPLMTKNIDVKVIPFEYAGMVVPIPGTEDALNRIERTHELRVGYNPKVMPFVYFNNQGQLVGFDIAYIYALAAELHVKLIFVPFHWNNLIDDMDENKFDIAVSSIFLTTGRLERVLYTTPTHFTSMAFLIKRDEQQNYTDRRTIIAAKRLEIGVLNNNEKIRRLGNYLPQASITVFNDYPAAIKELLAGKIQAVFLPRYQARAWASLYPETVAIEPEDLVTPKIPVAFMVSKNSPQLYHFMDRWLEIKKKESFEKKMFEYWVLGNQIGITKTRWNIIDAIISKKGN